MGDENPNPGTGTPAPDNNPNPNPQPGTAPTSPANGGTGEGLDLSKLSDSDFAKLYDDPRLYNHPRFKELNDKAKVAKQLQQEKKEREEAELKQKGEFEKLAKQKDEELQQANSKFNTMLTDNAIMAEASKRGIKDLDAAIKLIDRSQIKVGEEGQVVGIAEAMDALVKERSYLLTINRNSMGSPTNPSNPNTQTKFKMSQLQDPKFYQDNYDAIQKAIAAGEVEDDR